MNRQETFEALKKELADVIGEVEATGAELEATRTSGKSDKTTVDAFTRLQSKVALLTARKTEIEAGLPAAELAALREVAEQKSEAVDVAAEALRAEEDQIRERFKELFDYPSCPLPLHEIIRMAKPVFDLSYAFRQADSERWAANDRAERYAADKGLDTRRDNELRRVPR